MTTIKRISSDTKDSALVAIGGARPPVVDDALAGVSSQRIFKSDASKRLPDFSNSRLHSLLFHCEIKSVDNNKLLTSRALNRIYNSDNVPTVRVYGRTWFMDFVYNFPIYCSRQEFVRFLSEVRTHKDRKLLFHDGIITQSMIREFPYVWRNFLSKPSCFRTGSSTLSLGSLISILYALFRYWRRFPSLFLFVVGFSLAGYSCFLPLDDKRRLIYPIVSFVCYALSILFYFIGSIPPISVLIQILDSWIVSYMNGYFDATIYIPNLLFGSMNLAFWSNVGLSLNVWPICLCLSQLCINVYFRRYYTDAEYRNDLCKRCLGIGSVFAIILAMILRIYSCFFTIAKGEDVEDMMFHDYLVTHDEFIAWQLGKFHTTYLSDTFYDHPDARRIPFVAFHGGFDYFIRIMMFYGKIDEHRLGYLIYEEAIDVTREEFQRVAHLIPQQCRYLLVVDGQFPDTGGHDEYTIFQAYRDYLDMHECEEDDVVKRVRESWVSDGSIFSTIYNLANLFHPKVRDVILDIVVFMTNDSSLHAINVIFEECIKSFYVTPLNFALFELALKIPLILRLDCDKRYWFNWSFSVVFMHIVVAVFPLPVAMGLHYYWNVHIAPMAKGSVAEVLMATISEYSPDAQKVEEFAFIFDVVLKMVKRDTVGLMLSAGMRATHFSNLMQLLQIKDAGYLLHFVSEDEILVLGPVDFAYNLADTLLPLDVSKSPFFRKVVAFGIVLACSPFVSEIGMVKSISSHIDWEAMAEGQGFVEITISAVVATYQAMTRVFASGSWKDIFGLPADVKFIRESRERLMEFSENHPLETVGNHIRQAEELIKSRDFKVNTGEITGLINKLVDFIKVKKALIENFKKRVPPIPIFLVGSPGTGKTIAQDILCDVLRREYNLEQFPGDTVNYNCLSKFPAETGLSREALFFICNDLPDNYSNYAMMDREALDTVLQRLIDTALFEVRAAAVESKGKALNNLKFAMFSSNYTEFVGEQDSKKLLRRLSSGVSVGVTFKDNKGCELSFEDVKHLSDAERQGFTRFEILEPYSSGKHFGFKPTRMRVTYNLPQFIAYVLSVCRKHEEMVKETFTKFYDPANRCSCGAPKSIHYVVTRGVEKYFKINDKFCPAHPDPVNLENAPFSTPGSQVVTPSSFQVLSGSVYRYTTFDLMLYSLCSSFIAVITFWVGQKVRDYYDFYKYSVILHPYFSRVYSICRRCLDRSYKLESDYALKIFLFYARVRRFVERNKQVLLGVSVGLAAYYATRKSMQSVQAVGNPIFRDKVDSGSIAFLETDVVQGFTPEQQRKWNKPEVTIEIAKLQKVGVGLEDLIKICSKCIRKAEMVWKKQDGSGMEGIDIYVVFLNPRWMLLNKHYVRSFGEVHEEFTVILAGKQQKYLASEAVDVGDSEFFMFMNHFDSTVPALADFLILDAGNHSNDCFVPISNFHGLCRPVSIPLPTDSISYKSFAWEEYLEPGVCGNALLINSRNGWGIAGFICARGELAGLFGKTKVTAASIVTRDMFVEAAKKCPLPEFHSHSIEVLGMVIDPLSQSADIRNVRLPGLIPVGTLREPTKHFKSKIVRTFMYDDVSKLLSEEYDVPTKLKGEVDGDYASCFTTTFENVTFVNEVPYSVFKKAMRGYLDDSIPSAYIQQHSVKLRPASLAEAFFGDPKINMDRVNFKSAVGRQLRLEGITNKYDLFDLVDEQNGIYALKSGFRDSVERLYESVKAGYLPSITVDFREKDEVRKKSRLQKFKIRLFSVVDFHYNILLRMYAMPIISILMGAPSLSECYGGINAGSISWHELALRLKKNPYYIDMDFSTFDSTHSMLIVQIVAEYFYWASIRCGYSLDDATILHRLIIMMELQVLIYNCDVILKTFGLPSGIIITLIMNSVVNSILMRVAFILLTKFNVELFRQFVVCATTGDDNASSVSATIIKVFNMVTISQVYKAIGYTVTSASKDAIVEHIPFEKLTFLKRRFRWDDKLGVYMAPIEKDSIYKQMCFQSRDADVSMRQRLCDVAETVQREAWLHGEEFFKETQEYLVMLFKKHQMELGLKLIPEEELIKRFREGTFTTFMC